MSAIDLRHHALGDPLPDPLSVRGALPSSVLHDTSPCAATTTTTKKKIKTQEVEKTKRRSTSILAHITFAAFSNNNNNNNNIKKNLLDNGCLYLPLDLFLVRLVSFVFFLFPFSFMIILFPASVHIDTAVKHARTHK